MKRVVEIGLAGVIALGGMAYVMTPPGVAEWASSADMIRGQFDVRQPVRRLQPATVDVAEGARAMSADDLNAAVLASLTSGAASNFDLGDAGTVKVAVVNVDDTASNRLFSPYGDERSPLVLDPARNDTAVAVAYERRFETRSSTEDLDVSITPRAAFAHGPEGSTARAGAEVRVGRYRGRASPVRPRWYVFAGADRRALMYDPREGANLRHAMVLSDRLVVGDAQAGVAVRLGEVDLSLAYVRREYKHVAGVTSFDETEQFGAVSVNWTW
ncbi:lipid A-modifier LpxR family protein [Maricaulis sp. CAU 1757]